MVDVIEDITYRDQSMAMPASLEARVFLPGTECLFLKLVRRLLFWRVFPVVAVK